MLDLLSNRAFEGFDVIRELARARALLMLAFEGVLATPGSPAPARLDGRTRALLRAAALLYPCAVVTGGSAGAVSEQVERVPALSVVGSDGVTRASAVERFALGFPPWPVVYVGASPDDEPVFRSATVTHAVRVGPGRSAARYFVNDREGVVRLLSELVTERARIAGLGVAWLQLERDRNLRGSA